MGCSLQLPRAGGHDDLAGIPDGGGQGCRGEGATRLSQTRQHAAEERANTVARDLESLNLANNLIESGLAHAGFAEWSKAEAELSQAVKTRPDHSYVWLTRGDQYARLGLWDLAAADFRHAFQLKEPASTRALCLHAILSFYVGDAKGYRRICERMTARLPEAYDDRACDEISQPVSSTYIRSWNPSNLCNLPCEPSTGAGRPHAWRTSAPPITGPGNTKAPWNDSARLDRWTLVSRRHGSTPSLPWYIIASASLNWLEMLSKPLRILWADVGR